MNYFEVCVRLRSLLPFEDQQIWQARHDSTNNHFIYSLPTQPSQSDLATQQSKDRKRLLAANEEQFAFDFIETDSKTQGIYLKRCRPILNKVLQGFNGTVLCYGQTTSGKTYTTLGEPNNPGILPCTLKDLFNKTQQKISISYIQIYNEQIDDLLSEESKNLKLIDDCQWGTQIQGCIKKQVKDFNQAINLLEIGEQKRIYRETKIHENSSRSHTIFRIVQLINKNKHQYIEGVRNSIMNIVDLAGSESEGGSGPQSETSYINKSLFSLTNVVNKLADKAKHIPYRDSKLTRLLRESLSGNSYMSLICCVSPARKNYLQTLSTLKFGVRAKKVQVNPTTEEIPIRNLHQEEIEELKKEIEQLKQQLLQKDEEINNKSINTNQEISNQIYYYCTQFDYFDTASKISPQLAHNKMFAFLLNSEQEFRNQYNSLVQAYRKNLDTVLKSQAIHLQENKWLYEYIVKIISCEQIHCYAFGPWQNMIVQDEFVQAIPQKCPPKEALNIIDQVAESLKHQLDNLLSESLQYLEQYYKKKQIILTSIQGDEMSNLNLLKEHEEAAKNCQDQYNQQIDELQSIISIISNTLTSQSSLHQETIRYQNSKQLSPKQDHSLLLCGSGQDGRLGFNEEKTRKLPTLLPNHKFAQVACGYHHTIALTANGQVFSWGRGQRGQLGLGENCQNQLTPMMVLGDGIIEVAAGWQHSLALTNQGNVYSWGYGEDGQLGLGDLFNSDKPQLIQQAKHANKIYAGHSHSAYLTHHNQLYTFGNNSDGRCMNSDFNILASPQLTNLPERSGIISVGLGVSHMGVVLNNGEVYMAGQSEDGQLGIYLDENSENTEVIEFEEYCKLATFLVKIDKFGHKNKASQIACGDEFSLVLTEKGMVYSFGKASYYRLGQEKIQQDEKLFEATPIFGLKNVKKVVAGCRNGGTINNNGSMYLWGFNFHNQLGLGENDQDQAEPILIDKINEQEIKDISLGYFHTAILI